MPSTNSTSSSTAACSFPGTPLVARRATIASVTMNSVAITSRKTTLSI
jgi:hypothetical protein